MSRFPDTPVTLLARLASDITGRSEAQWTQLIELYRPTMVKFAESLGAKSSAEDIVQDVLVSLVSSIRRGGYNAKLGKFHSYLAASIRNRIINWRDSERSRGADGRASLGGAVEAAAAVPPEAPAVIDAKWRLACRAAAMGHVLTKTALAARTKDIYRAYVIDGRPIGDVAKEFGVSRNVVAQAKTRIESMIAGYEKMLAE